MDCIFCKIVNKELPTDLKFENDECIIINNIHPKTPIHHLLIPKKHIDSISSLTEGDAQLMGNLLFQISKYGKQNFPDGYRFAVNVDEHGGQTVRHLHFHILAGKKFAE